MIASKGGSLPQQIRRAEAYAVAEAELNPRRQKVESLSQVDSEGQLTQVNIIETPAPVTDEVDTKISVVETMPGQEASEVVADVAATTSVPTENIIEDRQTTEAIQDSPLRLPPFRDPNWEQIELAYHSAALRDLNSLTRSYNLMAPELAKKPYYSLPRELASCFADVAPQLANEIQERARKPAKIKVEIIGHTPGSVLERFGGETAKVYDSRKPNYGFKEFWRELWNSGDEKRA